MVLRKEEVQTERLNVIEDQEYLQLAAMRLQTGKTFKPHKHVVCIKDTIIEKPILHSGDCSVTLYGGHTYEILEDDTVVYEYKTGPYLGIESDKEFI